MKYKYVISGAAETGYCSDEAEKKAYDVGQEVIKQGGVVVSGATTGMPLWAAKGAKEAGGISIGLSPASTQREHVEKYKLPLEYFDLIIYTGFDYSGRNLMLTKSGDAVIVICGGFGTLNEFTIALEDNKPIGIFTGTGGVSDEIGELMEKVKDPHNHGAGRVIFSDDPVELVTKLKDLITKDNKYLKQ
jgi:uncharacterized protein (TIGR00725 family)